MKLKKLGTRTALATRQGFNIKRLRSRMKGKNLLVILECTWVTSKTLKYLTSERPCLKILTVIIKFLKTSLTQYLHLQCKDPLKVQMKHTRLKVLLPRLHKPLKTILELGQTQWQANTSSHLKVQLTSNQISITNQFPSRIKITYQAWRLQFKLIKATRLPKLEVALTPQFRGSTLLIVKMSTECKNLGQITTLNHKRNMELSGTKLCGMTKVLALSEVKRDQQQPSKTSPSKKLLDSQASSETEECARTPLRPLDSISRVLSHS